MNLDSSTIHNDTKWTPFILKVDFFIGIKSSKNALSFKERKYNAVTEPGEKGSSKWSW